MLISNIKKKDFKTQLIYFLFIVPALIVFIVFRAWPIMYSFILSFFDVNIISGNTFLGLNNYISLINDPSYIKSFMGTIRFTLIVLPLTILWSLLVSIILDYKFLKYSNVFKGIFFMPFVTSWIVISLIWKWFLNSKFGVVNEVLSILHLPEQDWLTDPDVALWAVIGITIWKMGGYFILIFVANLQIVDPCLYEAAEVDGANFCNKFRYITLNALKPAFYITLITGTIFYFRTFTIIFAMTGGDPLGSTDLIAYHTYKLAFLSFDFGRANASITFMFAFIGVVLLLQTVFFERRD